MNSKKRITRVAIYKLCKFNSSDNRTNLKAKLDRALRTLQKVGERRFNTSSTEDPCFHIVSSPQSANSPESGFAFGTLMTYTPGKDSLFIIDDDQASDVLLEQLTAEVTKEGKRREFLDSLIYFCVKGNHISLIQSQHLKSDHLCRYITWLLKKSGELHESDSLTFLDTPPPHQQERLKLAKGIKSIQFTSMSNVAEREASCGTMDLFPTDPKQDGNIIQRMLRMFIEESGSSKINFSSLFDSNIKVGMSFALDRETSDGGQKLMDEIGSILRSTEDIDTILELKDGGTIRGSMLKLTYPIRLNTYGGQLSASEVYGELKKWLTGVLEKKLSQ